MEMQALQILLFHYIWRNFYYQNGVNCSCFCLNVMTFHKTHITYSVEQLKMIGSFNNKKIIIIVSFFYQFLVTNLNLISYF